MLGANFVVAAYPRRLLRGWRIVEDVAGLQRAVGGTDGTSGDGCGTDGGALDRGGGDKWRRETRVDGGDGRAAECARPRYARMRQHPIFCIVGHQ